MAGRGKRGSRKDAAAGHPLRNNTHEPRLRSGARIKKYRSLAARAAQPTPGGGGPTPGNFSFPSILSNFRWVRSGRVRAQCGNQKQPANEKGDPRAPRSRMATALASS
jgi:hypothetical protein